MPAASEDLTASRILVYGVTGSGKSTAAEQIGARTGLPVTLVDELTWLPGWVPVEPDRQRELITAITVRDRWVLDSAYGVWLDAVLPRTELIVALDYPRWFSLRRLIRRTLLGAVTKQPRCNGNTESFRNMFGRRSIIRWHFPVLRPEAGPDAPLGGLARRPTRPAREGPRAARPMDQPADDGRAQSDGPGNPLSDVPWDSELLCQDDGMWQPEPGWHLLTGGTGISTIGVWRTVVDDRPVAVKRLAAPAAHDPAELSDPRHFAYWRRAADVARSGIVAATPGLRGPLDVVVEEDVDGITLVQDWVEDAAVSGLFAAHAIGRFAGADLGGAPWLARDQLRDRMDRVARRGGWKTLARTTVADVADHLWCRRESFLDALDELAQVPQHGDPVPANLPGREADEVIAIDWGTLGHGPVGADLGYHALSAREAFEPLLDAYLLGLPDGLADPQEAALGARVTAVYTVLTRADWALARVAEGEGALTSKYRHPSVAPYLRAMQRQAPQIEELLGRS